MRLVDADNIQEELAALILYSAGTPEGECVDYAHNLIDAQPTIDAVPVVHAHVVWAKQNGSYQTQCCSNCHRTCISRPDEAIEFCPHCGAKMDKVEMEEADDE